jgi:O-antigen/teichoic acid export membrane protein
VTVDEVKKDESAAVEGEVRSLARSSSFSFFGLIANAVLGFVFTLLISRTLNQVAAGGVFEAIAIFTTASLIATAGANIGLMRTLPNYRRRSVTDVRRSVLVAIVPTVIIGIGIAVVLFIEAPEISIILVHRALLRPEATAQLRVVAPVIPAAAATYVLLGGDRAWSITPSVTVQYIFIPFVRPLLFFAFLGIGMTAFRATLAYSLPVGAALVITVVITSLRLRSRSAIRRGTVPEAVPLSYRVHASTFWRFAAPRSIEGILLVFLTGFDIVLVGALSNARDAATYTIANRYITMSIFGLQAILVAIPVRISDLMHTGLATQARELYRTATWWTVAMCWPAALALAAFAPVFMSVFGQSYRSGGTALLILSVGVLATSATGPCGAVLLMSGKSSANLLSTFLAVGCNVPLNFILIPRLGATGAAISWSVSMVITNVAQMYILWRMFRMHSFGREFALIAGTCVGIFAGVGVVVRLLLGTNIVALVIYSVIAVAAYALVLYRVRFVLRIDAFTQMIKGMASSSKGSGPAPSSAG